MVNWSEYTKLTLPFNCSNTTQDKAKVQKTHKAHRHTGAY